MNNLISIREFVDREVILCVSEVISELMHAFPNDYYEPLDARPDWHECAVQNGYDDLGEYDSWEDLCNGEGLDVSDYHKEVFEHWIVTPQLAGALMDCGETVLEYYHGLSNVWCRTTTGQAIYIDNVIEEIYQDNISG